MQTAYRRWLDDELPGVEARTGIRVAVENMLPLRVRGRKVARVHAADPHDDLGEVPHVVLDTSHAAVSGLHPSAALERIGDRLTHVHLSNNAGRGWDSHLPLREGVLDLESFGRALAARGTDASVSLEIDLRTHRGDEASMLRALRDNAAVARSSLVPA